MITKNSPAGPPATESGATLRARGLRLTTPRRIILDVVRATDAHPTATLVYRHVRRRLPRVSLATVYRNLEALAASGQVRRIDGPGTHRRFDGNTKPHHHARCRVCDRIIDLFDIPDQGLDLIAERECGFTISATSIEFTGVCDSCRSRQPTTHQAS